jgi:hypothetical protein
MPLCNEEINQFVIHQSLRGESQERPLASPYDETVLVSIPFVVLTSLLQGYQIYCDYGKLNVFAIRLTSQSLYPLQEINKSK